MNKARITDASSEDVANGKFTSWSSAKQLEFQAMRHGVLLCSYCSHG